MDKDRQARLYELLKRGLKNIESGEDLPTEWAREFFPPERREYELVYHGKESEEQILADTMAVPLQPVSTFGGSDVGWHNQLIFGDNLQSMKTLLQMKERGELINADGTSGVKLVYIDPPFSTRRDFRGTQDQKAYQDKLAGAEFLEFLRKRLVLLKELLSEDGSIFVHLDLKKGHYAKVLLDEVFGENNFLNEIVWNYRRWPAKSSMFQKMHESIYWYAKNSNNHIWNQQYEALSASTLKADGGFKIKNIINDEGHRVRGEKGTEKSPGTLMRAVWDISFIASTGGERIDYPTQKPEKLLERIIVGASNPGDIVLDAFAGSGTTCAVAEKLKRRWVAIDCGKLSIYTIQKRMLNLHIDIGNKGKPLQPRPFTLSNAGLYDFDSLRQLPWEKWRFFALQLFGCKDEPHKIRGFQLDGKKQGASVLVFNHFTEGTISHETIADIHASIGKQIGSRCFIIAPRGAFLFQEDYIELDGVRYYALRIPYSFINEIHTREFSALSQPSDETAVNETVEAVGFDFIQAPAIEFVVLHSRQSPVLKIKKFESKARVRGEETIGGLETLSMVMADFSYKGNVFELDKVYYAQDLKRNGWSIELPVENIEGDVMFVFLDIYGNEARISVAKEHFKTTKPLKKTVKKVYAKTRAK